MSITAMSLRQRGYSWREIAEYPGFRSPAAARWAVLRTAAVLGESMHGLDGVDPDERPNLNPENRP